MKRLTATFALLVAFALPACAQQKTGEGAVGYATVQLSHGAPSGNCLPSQIDFDLDSQNTYNCPNLVWQQMSGSGGGGSSSLTVKTNGNSNADQATLDFSNPAVFSGLTLAFSNPTGGTETLSLSGALTNAGLANPFATVNSQTCTLGSSCTIPFQTNGVANTSQAGINFKTSTTNAVGLTVTPTNPGTNGQSFEITGSSYTGNSATASALAATPSQCANGISQGITTTGACNALANVTLSNLTTAARTTTIPDASTVWPQPLASAANTYVTGLNGTTGALSTAIVGLPIVKKTATYAAVDADRGREFDFTLSAGATFTAAPAANNWYVPAVVNDPASTATLTIAVPSGTLTNLGGCTVSTNQIALAAGFHVALATDNTNWYGICSVAGTGGVSFPYWTPGIENNNTKLTIAGIANNTYVAMVDLPSGQSFGHMLVDISTADAANNYSFGLVVGSPSGAATVICTTTAGTLASTGPQLFACSQGTVTTPALTAGQHYYVVRTGAATTAQTYEIGAFNGTYPSAVCPAGSGNGPASTGGAIPTISSLPADSWTDCGSVLWFKLAP